MLNEPNNPYGNNSAFRASGLQCNGDASLKVLWQWVDPADPDAWVRLTTYNGAIYPNPVLHLGGKVKFCFTNQSEVLYGNLGVCIGVRETGVVKPQLEDGGLNGEIEWIGVSTVPNAIIAGADGIVDTTATGDDVQIYPVSYDVANDPNILSPNVAVIGPGPNGTIETTPTPDDELRYGYFINAIGERTPVPAIELHPFDAVEVTLEWDLTTGVVSKDGSPQPNSGIVGMTGDGVITESYGTLEHIAFVNDPDDVADDIELSIDDLQFISPVPDPVLPPRVVWPIIADDTEVIVTDLMTTVDQVTLYDDGGQVEQRNVTDPNDVVFTIAGGAQAGNTYYATQRDSVTSITSGNSDGVLVLAEAPPYTFSILVDEGGTGSCNYNYGWEWVGVTSVGSPGWQPQGTSLLFPDDTQWQVVDIPLTDNGIILPGLGGDGSLAPAGGNYTMDSIWFTIANAATGDALGPWEIFIDEVQLLDPNGLGDRHHPRHGGRR